MITRTFGLFAALASATVCAAPPDGVPPPADEIPLPRLGGRLMLDAASFDNDERGADNVGGTELRRVWVDAQGSLYGISYKIEFDITDDKTVARDLYLARNLGNGKLTVGQFKQYFTLEDRTSSKFITLMEPSFLAQTLVPSYQVGIGYQGAADSGSFSYGASVYNIDTNDPDAVEGMGSGGRVTLAPWRATGRVLHFGGAAIREHYGNDSSGGKQTYKLSVRSAGHMADNSRPTLLSIENGHDIDVFKYGLEFAAVLGPFSLQCEYAAADADDGVYQGEISGQYAYLSYFATGESRPYDTKSGSFTRIRPSRSSGAWELAVRYDTIGARQNDMFGTDPRKVEVTAITAGANWYINPNARVMLNYIVARTHETGATSDETNAITGRVQIDF